MATRTGWTRQQLLVAFKLYCQIPFGKFHTSNPDIIKYAEWINRTPSALSMKLSNIASLDPAITSTGRKGLKAASAADKAMWEEMQSNWESFAIETQKAVSSFGTTDETETDLDHDPILDKVADYTGSDKTVQTTTRIGQNFFRRSVLSAYDGQCCITGLAIPKLLIASHIVPWRNDAANRLNPQNGLCLSMLHDKAFDIGIITIAKDMTVRVSRKHKAKSDYFFDTALLAYDGKPISLPDKFRPSEEFLTYHRQNVFES
ncbi:restriction endonuclease [Candidatus Nitromaritima sp. SCGC AAA799-C22]|nr:restriction endonuclease [Candidatus Nitromaritima sp. SCGC AAA799-C22]